MKTKTELASQKFAFLLAVAKDPDLPKLASRIAALIAIHYMRSENDGVAWPSIATICKDLGMSAESRVRAALSAMVTRGHLVAIPRLGETTEYRLNPTAKDGGDPAAFDRRDPAAKDTGVGNDTPLQNAEGTPPKNAAATPVSFAATNKGYENRLRRQDIVSDVPPLFAGKGHIATKAASKKKRARARTAIREDAQPTKEDADAAERSGLELEEFRSEWAKFRDFHLSKGSVMADWSAAWRNWLRNIHQFNRASMRLRGLAPSARSGSTHLRHLEDLDRD